MTLYGLYFVALWDCFASSAHHGDLRLCTLPTRAGSLTRFGWLGIEFQRQSEAATTSVPGVTVYKLHFIAQ